MNNRMDEDTVSKCAQTIGRYYHEKLLLLIFFQTKPQVKNMKINYYDFSYTAIQIGVEKKL